MRSNPLHFSKLGSDPELFLFDSNSKQYISAIGLLGGSKESPRPVPGGYIVEDNVLAEINPDPAGTLEDFITNTKTCVSSLRNILGPEIQLHARSEVSFAQEYLESVGPMAFTSGCDPFFEVVNGMNMREVRTPSMFKQGGMRYAGGHLHISFQNPEDIKLTPLLILLNVFITQPLHMLSYHRGSRMAVPYGRWSAFRPKPYGIEYRAPLPTWLHTERTLEWVWNNVQAAISVYNKTSEEDNNVLSHIRDKVQTPPMIHFAEVLL